MFNILSDVDITGGFCAVVCYVKNDVVPIAYGINGNGSYDWKTILNATLPPVFPRKNTPFAMEQPNDQTQKKEDYIAVAPTPNMEKTQNGGGHVATNKTIVNKTLSSQPQNPYNDEALVIENYYQEQPHESIGNPQNSENAHPKSAMQAVTEIGTTPAENGNAESILHPFKTDGDGYYLSVKTELDELFRTYPKDSTLHNAFACSEWVRVKGTEKDPQYLVGVLYEEGVAKYICYALVANNKDNPPVEIKDVCTFVPVSALHENVGFFVIFQSANSGECIKPQQL
jgi:hypothetical protein